VLAWTASGPGNGSAHGVVIQFPFGKNADVVREVGGAAPQGVDNGGRAFVTQSEAAANDATDPRGLPDSGIFPLPSPVPEDNIRFDPYSGNNAWRFDDPASPTLTVNVPVSAYRSIHLYATGAEGSPPISVALHYNVGAPPVVLNLTVPDWFTDPPPAGTRYLIDGRDRTGAAGAGFEDVDDPAIFILDIPTDPRVELSHFNVAARPGFDADDVVTIYAASGDFIPEPGAAGILLAAAAALLGRRRGPA
jgi:hypothetical protein